MKTNITRKKLRFLIGGTLAALVPVGLGLLLLAIPIVASQDPSCNYGAKNVSMACNIYQEFGGQFYWLMMLPIILSFIFIAPIVAALCISELDEVEPLAWRDIFFTSIITSSRANAWVAIIYNGIALLILGGTVLGKSGAISAVLVFFMVLVCIQGVLWLCITLPLSLICAAIFGLIVEQTA